MRITIVLLCAVIALAATQPVSACKCIPNPPPRQAMASVNAVFAGTVVAVRTNPKGYTEVLLKVARTWKGKLGARTTVTTRPSSASCGFNFVPYERYIVYANRYPGQANLSVSLCSRTALLRDAKEDSRALGSGKKIGS